MTTTRTMVAMVIVGLLMAACGIPTSEQSTQVPPSRIPFHLLSPTVPTSTTTTRPAVAYVSEPIALLDAAGKIIAVDREVPVPAGLITVLDALFDGPTTAEASTGITTALPRGAQVTAASISNGTAVLGLNSAFAQLSGSAQVQAIGQIVLTATQQPGISAVAFEVAGAPISVPTGTGQTTSQPVSAADYATLAAAP